ncbi:MAG: hypothetical protein R3C14_43290 [Caldilineaceae bacterium]
MAVGCWLLASSYQLRRRQAACSFLPLLVHLARFLPLHLAVLLGAKLRDNYSKHHKS